MSWFGIPIELSRSELPDVVIHICWRSSRLGSLTGSSECVHRRERNQAMIGSHRECPPSIGPWSSETRAEPPHPTCCDLAWSVWEFPVI